MIFEWCKCAIERSPLKIHRHTRFPVQAKFTDKSRELDQLLELGG
jgi:hypothetical protein